MNPEAGRIWFRVAMFITLVSAGLLLIQQPGTAEFVITVATLVIGLVFIAILAVMARRANR